MEVAEPFQTDNGLWCTTVYPGHADVLLAALDPEHPFVLIETSDGVWDWHEATVSMGTKVDPRVRLVRRHNFDLLVSPDEAAEIGGHLRGQGLAGGGFRCHQFRRRPKASFDLPDLPRARVDAMRGQGVALSIDLPHDAEVALVSSPSKPVLDAFVTRLA